MANHRICKNCIHWREEAGDIGHCGHPDTNENLLIPLVAYASDTCGGWEQKVPKERLLQRLQEAGPVKKRRYRGRGLL